MTSHLDFELKNDGKSILHKFSLEKLLLTIWILFFFLIQNRQKFVGT